MEKCTIPQIPNLRKLRNSDKRLLERMLQKYRPESMRYEDSWGYIIQATRYCPAVFHDRARGEAAFLGRKKDGSAVAVVNHFMAASRLAPLAEAIRGETGLPVALKNISRGEEQEYLEAGFRRYRDSEQWNERYRYDDNTFPQRVLNLGQLGERRGREYRRLRREFSIFQRKHGQEGIFWREYSPTERKTAEMLLVGMAERIGDPEVIPSHQVYLADENGLRLFLANRRGVIAFAYVTPISRKCAAANATIVGERKDGIWRAFFILLGKLLSGKGYTHMNIGGSETEGADRFKLHLVPELSLEKTHLAYP